MRLHKGFGEEVVEESVRTSFRVDRGWMDAYFFHECHAQSTRYVLAIHIHPCLFEQLVLFLSQQHKLKGNTWTRTRPPCIDRSLRGFHVPRILSTRAVRRSRRDHTAFNFGSVEETTSNGNITTNNTHRVAVASLSTRENSPVSTNAYIT